jgi:predicted small secreted protein
MKNLNRFFGLRTGVLAALTALTACGKDIQPGGPDITRAAAEPSAIVVEWETFSPSSRVEVVDFRYYIVDIRTRDLPSPEMAQRLKDMSGVQVTKLEHRFENLPPDEYTVLVTAVYLTYDAFNNRVVRRSHQSHADVSVPVADPLSATGFSVASPQNLSSWVSGEPLVVHLVDDQNVKVENASAWVQITNAEFNPGAVVGTMMVFAENGVATFDDLRFSESQEISTTTAFITISQVDVGDGGPEALLEELMIGL